MTRKKEKAILQDLTPSPHCTPDEFDTLVREKFSFLTVVAQEGKVLYEKGN
jgi:hypothetical protein